MQILILATTLISCLSLAASSNTVSSPPVSARQPTCPDPRIEPVVVPLDMAGAAELVVRCSLDVARVRSEDERAFSIREHDSVGRAIHNTWLRERDSGVTKVLIDLGVQSTDDMSSLILSAAWHRAHGLPFDAAERVKCWQDAWKAARAEFDAGKKEVMIQTPSGILVPPPIPTERCYGPLPKPRG